MDIYTHGLIDATYRENDKKCKLTIGKQPIDVFAPGTFGLTKNGPYTKAVDEQ